MRKKKTKARTGVARRLRKKWFTPVVGAFLILAAAVGYYYFARQPSPAELQAAAANCSLEKVRWAERRSLLSSKFFVGRVRTAYATAKAIPAVLDRLYCYCRCKENMGHKSLLSCYADTHAANCNVCLTEAEMAAEMVGDGLCPDEIQQAIDRRFG